MDSQTLHIGLDFVGSSGVMLSPEHKAALQASLLILKTKSKFYKVKFWGKIHGLKDDYFIAQGVPRNELSQPVYLYSKDCVKWAQVVLPTDEMREKTRKASGRFTGDPSHEWEVIERKTSEEEIPEESPEEEETILVKEEDRLACVIESITNAVSIIPRGSYIRSAENSVVYNRSFGGLSVNEAAKLESYFHFREPIILPKKTLLERADQDKSTDFLDTVAEDIPKGSWSLQFEKGSGLVTLRSLLWPGYVFYHVPGTVQYGSIYWGTGEENIDLPFML